MHQSRWKLETCLENLQRTLPPDEPKCWPRLLRDVASVDENNAEDEQWKSSAKTLVRVYRDAKKLHSQRDTLAGKVDDRRVALLQGRLVNLASHDWTHADARRLSKRLVKYGNEFLTFLWHSDVASENNPGERAIRPAVQIRKNSYRNRSDRGALTQSVMMSISRALRLRGHQPLDTILNAVAEYSITRTRPPLPPKATRQAQ